jgi:cobyric acid synthase
MNLANTSQARLTGNNVVMVADISTGEDEAHHCGKEYLGKYSVVAQLRWYGDELLAYTILR